MAAVTQNETTMENVFGEDKKENIIQLRQLVRENSELNTFPVQDGYLLQFLNWTSFDVNVAIEKIKEFQDKLIKYSQWYSSKPPLELTLQLEKNAICLLDQRDKNGRAIYVIKVGNIVLNYGIEENSAILEMFVDCGHMQEETIKNGISVIIDMENIPWKILSWLTPRNIKTAVTLITTYPCKEIKLHVVKTSFILDTAIKILWPLLPASIKDMIKFHFNNWSSLHEYINPEDLPSEYGGTGPDIDFQFYNEKMYKQNEKIQERLEYRHTLWKINNDK